MHRSPTPPSTIWPTLACKVPRALPSTRAGSDVTTARARCSGTPLSCDHLRARLSSSSRPVAPGSASANGRVLASSSTGVWSDTSASTVPSSNAALKASRSRCWRSGGVRRARLSKKPMSFSVRCSVLMLMSQVTWRPSALARRTSSTPAALLRRHRCTRAPVVLSSSKMVCSAMVSAATGTPDRPRRVASAPLAATPLPRCISCGRSHTV
ncbi:hypothetical protein D3C72_1587680 [compost metagenome]